MGSQTKQWKFETAAVHAGADADPVTGARAIPIYRTAAYVFRNAEHAANLFALKENGYIYTRLGNPTQDALERRVADLEGGAAAVALASGTTAIFYAVVNLAKAGDRIVSAANLYGGTYTMFDSILPDFGIETDFVGVNDFDALERAIRAETRAVYVETIGNPSLDVADIPRYAEIAHAHGLPLIVDNTFATPWLCRPIELGADIVVHSLTKWMGGHGTAIGGVVVDSGRFDWSDPRFSLYVQPDRSYHGLRWGLDLGDQQALAFALRLRTVPLRNLGASVAPDNAFLFLQGLETLALRMERHCDNAMKVAEFLSRRKEVSWVRYPGLGGDPSKEIADRVLSTPRGEKGYGGMVVFGASGGVEAGKSFIDRLRLFSHLANVGDAKSLALHPATTSHSQLSEEAMVAAGLPPELVRLSIGIEHPDDIIADLQGALGT